MELFRLFNLQQLRHTEELLKKVMLLLNRLIFDEVQRKTCVSLPPDLIDFLDWMLVVNPRETFAEEVFDSPLLINNIQIFCIKDSVSGTPIAIGAR